tara:strand:- start:3038 stop:3760 length:723 start_codon:yes stop_codon:yes gene_type:complete
MWTGWWKPWGKAVADGCFVTGTDTGVGKTLVAGALLLRVARAGLRTGALKPVAAGAFRQGDQWVNEDGLELVRLSSADQSYEEVNPVVLEAAIAPHIAAAQQDRPLLLDELVGAARRVTERDDVDFVVVEGAGGWLVPLNHHETLADLAATLGLPVVLVVGMKLGCLSHAMLTVHAINTAGVRLGGWVASCIDPNMDVLQENLATLRECMPGPCLGVVEHLAEPTAEAAASFIDVGALLK